MFDVYRDRVRLLLLAVATLALAACGASTPAAPPLDRSALPELTHRDRELPPEELAGDAIDREAFEAVLAGAGYVGGREREFTGHTDTFDHVIARTLEFESAAGAERYLRWLDAHTLDVVGNTDPRKPLNVGASARLLELEPCSTCKKQLPTLLAAWRRDESVGTVLAAGRGLDRAAVTRLVREVDATIRDA